jgi:F-type H+-transporting ATPase subunit b
MPIDWFTVCAQALNFLVLVWLLKRFLYKPILRAIDARETRIAQELADADAKKAEAQAERDAFQRKNEAFDQQRVACESRMKGEVESERQRLLGEARQASDALAAQRREALEKEARSLDQAMGQRVRQEVFAIARKTLCDLASVGLEDCLCATFLRRLREMDGPAKAVLAQAFGSASEPALVRSAFELPPDQRAAIQKALNETFSADVRIRFETTPDLIGGVELIANGQKLAWSLANDLTSFEKSMGELIREQSMTGTINEPSK